MQDGQLSGCVYYGSSELCHQKTLYKFGFCIQLKKICLNLAVEEQTCEGQNVHPV